MKKQTKIIVFSIGFILLALIIWGLIGSSKAAEIGITCDFGIGQDGSAFCWTWHKNIIGEVGDTLNSLFKK